MANVLTYVAQGMINIVREKPEDPIMYLANFLREAGEQMEAKAYEKAKKKFYRIIAESEALK
jgi:hypothetical protein